jgi:SMODS and SLOG-associating 2TM effector domain 3/SMODS and SLOG-associating 2TM effector domain 1
LANGDVPASNEATSTPNGSRTETGGLGSDGLPSAYVVANDHAGRAQRHFLHLQRAQILIPLVAIGVGLVTTLDEHLGYLGVLATASAAAVAVLRLVQRQSRVETEWYETRAVAEEVKSIAWRYAARGAPFDRDEHAGAADDLLMTRVRELTRGPPFAVDADASEITLEMRSLRGAALSAREQAYRTERLDDQLGWYRARAAKYRTWATRCDLGLFALTAVTVVVGIFLIVDSGDAAVLGPIVGIAAAGSGAFAAWSGVRRYASSSTAYAGFAAELERLDAHAAGGVGESEWSQFVTDVESVLAREHVQWRAARH